jgi:hypothetical protein
VKLLRYAAIWVLAFCLFLLGISRVAEADHYQFLPLVPNTPLMQQLIKNQEYTWCVDSRAANYPNFVSQLTDVNDQYTARVGIKWRQVPFDTTCQVRHVMPDGITCSGWAAQIFYANWPVTVQYCWTLGYTDWRSAHGHELGHGLLGLHEQYRDSGGIGCTGRQDTVMDCGSGVRYPTVRDVSLGCSIIRTAWCGNPPAPPPPDVIYFSDGWGYRLSDQNWINPDGWPEWQPCNVFGERWNYHLNVVMLPGSSFYSRHFWSSAGAC